MDVHAPQPGRVVPLGDVPDPVFATAMVGPGVALDPEGEDPAVAVSPVSGTLMVAKPHAFLVEGAAGPVLVHLGIDTIELRGQGFEVLAPPGDQLEVGDPVVRWSPRAVTASERSPLVVVLAMGAPAGHLSSVPADGAALAAGDILFTWESAPGG